MENQKPYTAIDMSKIEDGQYIYKDHLYSKRGKLLGPVPVKGYESHSEYQVEIEKVREEARASADDELPIGGSHASKLLKIVKKREDVVVFRDSHGDPFVAFEVNGIRQIWPCRGKQFKQWLSFLYWDTYKVALPTDARTSVIATLEGSASFEKEVIDIQCRSAWLNDDLWYDLTNDGWQAIKVTSTGWSLVDKPPILFRRYIYNRAQVIPISGGDVRLLLKYFNISNPEHQLLMLVHLICAFIPDFAHPIILIHGPQGSTKTTFSKLERRVIDPSIMEVSNIPKNHKELIQVIAHNSFLFFDNVSYISDEVSDLLSKAITGSSFPKRELYSDDDDVIYTFRRSLGINGINMVAMRPDLLERSIILGLDRIEPENRRQEKELMAEFESDLPNILGGIFDVLVKALALKPTVRQPALPRMADFALWGCAIAEALGATQQEFLNAYNTNIELQTDTVINENLVASALIAFMQNEESEGRKDWSGTATKLLSKLTEYANFHDIDTHDKQWPKGSNYLSRQLNILKVDLLRAGYKITISGGQVRGIDIHKIEGALYMAPRTENLDF